MNWSALLADEPLPAAVIDLDAVERNTRTLLAHVGGKSARLATKSLRVPALLRFIAGLDPRVRGLMSYSAREARWLVEQGFSDVLVAYPVARAADVGSPHPEAIYVIDDGNLRARDNLMRVPAVGRHGAPTPPTRSFLE